MSVTALARLFFLSRQRALQNHFTRGEELQRSVLACLVSAAQDTQWGVEHGYDKIKSYDDFAARVPLNTYEELKSHIDRMRHGEKDVLWPGRVRWYAKSSGTTNDKSKFIPVSPQALRDTHYRGGQDAVAFYLQNNPYSRMLDGKGLILGGSHAPNYNVKDSLVGDLSAILIENINPMVNLIRVPGKKTALLCDFEEKRTRIAMETIGKNVTNLSGVPSWMLSVLKRVLEVSGKDNILGVWPNLEVFFHGGVAFTPYREQYASIIRGPGMNYMETYNASEGFFGLQCDPAIPAMLLMLDYGVFYEFIPMEQFGLPNPDVVPLWGVETGRNYAMVISTSSGLWRYIIGDTVRFTSTNPWMFFITGRTKSFINAFGEELIVDNAEQGLRIACDKTGAQVRDYTAAPVFMDHDGKCSHQWLIDFATAPQDVGQFAHILDTALQELNSDYEAKRFKDITLQRLQIVVARPGLFDEWLASKGKLGGQHKVPRLSNHRQHIDELLSML